MQADNEKLAKSVHQSLDDMEEAVDRLGEFLGKDYSTEALPEAHAVSQEVVNAAHEVRVKLDELLGKTFPTPSTTNV